MLTSHAELMSRQALDFIFHVDPSTAKAVKGLKIVPNSLQVQKMMVKDLVKKGILQENSNRQPRPYTQLSDHYGLSIDFEV